MLCSRAYATSSERKLGYALGKHRQENLYVGHTGGPRSLRCAHDSGPLAGN